MMSIESIKEQIVEIEQQKAALDERITGLRRLLAEQEETARRNKKLSPKMAEVVKAMADGATLRKSRGAGSVSTRYYLSRDGQPYAKLSGQIFDGLLERRVIEHGEGINYWTSTYTLTDWGREVAGKLA